MSTPPKEGPPPLSSRWTVSAATSLFASTFTTFHGKRRRSVSGLVWQKKERKKKLCFCSLLMFKCQSLGTFSSHGNSLRCSGTRAGVACDRYPYMEIKRREFFPPLMDTP